MGMAPTGRPGPCLYPADDHGCSFARPMAERCTQAVLVSAHPLAPTSLTTRYPHTRHALTHPVDPRPGPIFAALPT